MSGLRHIVPKALQAVCLDSVRRFFAKCRRYEDLYWAIYTKQINEDDIPAARKLLKRAEHRYRSHRAAPAFGPEAHENVEGCYCST